MSFTQHNLNYSIHHSCPARRSQKTSESLQLLSGWGTGALNSGCTVCRLRCQRLTSIVRPQDIVRALNVAESVVQELSRIGEADKDTVDWLSQEFLDIVKVVRSVQQILCFCNDKAGQSITFCPAGSAAGAVAGHHQVFTGHP